MTQQRKGTGRVLVVGMGISGIATAARLRASGWTPVIVEKAPARRSGGYMLALFGTGRFAAERLGMLDHMHDRMSAVPTIEVDRSGRTRPGMSLADVPGEGAPWMVLRGDVADAAFAALPDDVEVRYCTTPTAIAQDGDGVDVTLLDTAADSSTTERFDLVVGADGLRSTVRRLAFGPHEDHLHRLNYMLAACQLDHTPAGIEQGQTTTLLEPDRGLTLMGYADAHPAVLLSYRTEDVDAEFTAPPADRLRAAFGPEPLGDLLTTCIDAFEADLARGDALFDSAEQVRMDRWYQGRVVLVGDAAWCVTLYAGMGASSGLSGACLLGEMLDRHPGDVPAALATWDRGMRPHIESYQRNALMSRAIFVPDRRSQIVLRRGLARLQRLPVVKDLLRRIIPAPPGSAVDIAADPLREPVAAG